MAAVLQSLQYPNPPGPVIVWWVPVTGVDDAAFSGLLWATALRLATRNTQRAAPLL